eukprot:TRINITY_DN91183_c0_g1_i1.p1 TRINITY_DN91183_c0_g1~~TRINITY_DN91183_c0_g1_i1.p1  ORF type:complete len:784 (-),score=234.97 TRINITY_DN91183_c0_g1_i1:168-2477(-)
MGCSNSKGGDSAQQEDGPKMDEGTFMFLQKVQLFKRLPEDDLPALAKVGKNVTFDPEQAIINQGEEGKEFYVIKKGNADVKIDGKKVASLKTGDYFGENALLRTEPRNASIIATTKVVTFRITRDDFTKLGLAEKLEFAKRGAVAGGAGVAAAVKPPTPKKDEDVQLIVKAVKSNVNLSTIAHLDDAHLKALADIMWLEDVPAGQAIIKEGDDSADYFYVVKSGCFAISKKGGAQSAESAQTGSTIADVKEGGSFGELALMYFAPRAATITAKEDSSVWVTARQQFKDILLRANEDELKDHLNAIARCKVFDALKDNERKELASAMHEMSFSKNETIFEQGEKGTQFFLLIEGAVSVIKDGSEQIQLEASTEKAQYFGEKALESNEPRTATIKVISDTAKALWVDKESFEMLLGSLTDLTKRGKDGNAVVKKAGAVAPTAGSGKRFGNIKMKNFKKIGLLGCGGFGAVEMVEDSTTKETYALKALSKGYVVKSGMQASVISEKNVQLMCDSDFIVKLYETYNSKEHLYFLLELALGGELYATYNKKNFWGQEKHAKFYVAGTVFAFDHLHSKKILFRDLKPENLLLNEKGQVKLTDMGLAKVSPGKTYTTCGTPDYFAPEVISSKGQSPAVDWWTLGILTFELMSGHPPFESATPMQIYTKVQKGINKVAFPKKLQGPVEKCVKGLCAANPTDRLPMKKGGVDNIKQADWFNDFDWKAMEELTMDTPYKPQVKGKTDIQNFSASKEDMPPHVPYKDPKTGWDDGFATSE